MVEITRQLKRKPPKVPGLDFYKYDDHNICLMLVVGLKHAVTRTSQPRPQRRFHVVYVYTGRSWRNA